MAGPGLVARAAALADRGANQIAVTQHCFVPTSAARNDSSSVAQITASGMQDIGSKMLKRGYTKEAMQLSMGSWRKATQKSYNVYLAKWKSYAQ